MLRPFILLWDHDNRDILSWQTHLRFLHRWSIRIERYGITPLLLVVTHSIFRAEAFLGLAAYMRHHMSKLIVASTAHLQTAQQEGLLAISHLSEGWLSLTDGGIISPIDPFLLPSVTQEQLVRSRYSIVRRSARQRISSEPDTTDIPSPLETLSPAERGTFTFLCQNPVIPEPALATLLEVPPKTAAAHLTHLTELGLAERTATDVRNLSTPMWAASEQGVREWLASDMLPPSLRKRYGFYRADHERRAHHTLAVYGFFADLKQQCARRSRAMRKLDAPERGVNEGKIPYFNLEVFESECTASDWFASLGSAYYFRPDGLGALRAGRITTYFWVEIDGTPAAPSQHDPRVWMGKMARLCDYIVSGRWTLRYPELPRLLIVTTDLRNIDYITDACGFVANSRRIDPPRVFVASSEAVRQRGPLSKIWREIGAEAGDEFGYAWEGVEAAPQFPAK